jgi:hypothetical protein
MTTTRKGDGAAGGGLAARIEAWEKMSGAGNTSPTTKKIGGYTYTKPGSQNSRKGGRGK